MTTPASSPPPAPPGPAAVPLYGFDAFSPQEVSERIERLGVVKARLPVERMLMLAALAGTFIGFGALCFVLVASDPTLGFAARRVLGGAVFSLGLLLVVVAGAELFTGNNLLVMAWVSGRIRTGELLRNWVVVLFGNALGAAMLAFLVALSGHLEMNGGLVRDAYLAIAGAKTSIGWGQAFVSGILCNALVCLAVWMATAGRSVVDKLVAILFPIGAFVAAGFEHSVANLYLIPTALIIKWTGMSAATPESLTLAGLAGNVVPVALGNIVGGGLGVAAVYWVIYRQGRTA